MPLFDETTLRKLEQLTLIADHVRVGVMKGDRRSKKRGTSIEFADYRNYSKGDDLRRLDWNVYARLERPFIKLLEEEEDLAVHLLVDTSASMNWPDTADDENKLRYALKLAGALGHVALATGDLLTVTLLNSDGDRTWGPFRGQGNSLRLFQFLESCEASGVTDVNLSLRNYALYGRRPGLLFLLSDLLSPNGYKDGLNAIQSRGYEIGLLHLLSPDEVEPPLSGDLKLVDVETGQDAEITLDAPTLALYQERLRAWQTEIATYCAHRHLHYIPVTTSLPWEKLVVQTLREKGVVK
ncbi:MAG TPA: DUF58 domain-containing protein [Chloroflexota bacterium]|nr:DUF58 domain-containing protein [Chloroflexota bacterium]